MDDGIDLSTIDDERTDPKSAAWRLHAVRLAFERHLDGRAWLVSKGMYFTSSVYQVASSTEPKLYTIWYDPRTLMVDCPCPAGSHNKPCAHAGSVLLLACDLAPENGITQPEENHGPTDRAPQQR